MKLKARSKSHWSSSDLYYILCKASSHWFLIRFQILQLQDPSCMFLLLIEAKHQDDRQYSSCFFSPFSLCQMYCLITHTNHPDQLIRFTWCHFPSPCFSTNCRRRSSSCLLQAPFLVTSILIKHICECCITFCPHKIFK